MDTKKIGIFIQEERKKLNLTQDELANKIYTSNKAISKWETGKGLPNVENLKVLAKIFNVSINEILQGQRDVKDSDIIITETLKNSKKIKIINFILTCLVGISFCLLEVVLVVANVSRTYGIIIFIIFFLTGLIIEYVSKHQ